MILNLIIVDANNIGHIATHSMGGLSFHEQETGVIFGFLQQVLRLSSRLSSNQFVFCWDSHNSIRKSMSSVYKNKEVKKEKTDQENELDNIAFEQFDTIREEVLPKLGFKNNFIKRGYEGDDVIASIVINTKWQGRKIIVSSDEDLWQLLDFSDIWQMKKKKLFCKHDFLSKWDIQPQDWAMVKALGGCSSDNVIGQKGVADITAAKFLRGELLKGKAYEALFQNNEALLLKNLPLVKLPLEGTGTFNVVKCQYRKDDFLDVFDEYGFRSFLKNDEWKRWVELFDLK